MGKYTLSGVKIAFIDFENKNAIATGIRNDWPELVAILNKGLAQMGSARIQEIVAQWTDISARDHEIQFTPEEEAWLDEHPVIRVAATPDWAPINMVDSEGEWCGLSADYLNLIAERLALRVEVVRTSSWADALKMLEEREADLLPSAVDIPKRRKFASFTQPYLSIPLIIFTRKGTNVIEGAEPHHSNKFYFILHLTSKQMDPLIPRDLFLVYPGKDFCFEQGFVGIRIALCGPSMPDTTNHLIFDGLG